jgi:hypothetical protein
MQVFRRVVLVAVAATACSDSTGPKATATGQWEGTILEGSVAGQVIRMNIVESNGDVSGSGQFVATTLDFIVDGTFSSPNLSITIQDNPLRPPANVIGTIRGNRFEGSINGSGFSGQAVEMTRTN